MENEVCKIHVRIFSLKQTASLHFTRLQLFHQYLTVDSFIQIFTDQKLQTCSWSYLKINFQFYHSSKLGK